MPCAALSKSPYCALTVSWELSVLLPELRQPRCGRLPISQMGKLKLRQVDACPKASGQQIKELGLDSALSDVVAQG